MVRRRASEGSIKPCRRLLANVTDSVTGLKIHAMVENHGRRKSLSHDALVDSMTSTTTASTECSVSSLLAGSDDEEFSNDEYAFDVDSLQGEVRVSQKTHHLDNEEAQQIGKLARIIITEPTDDVEDSEDRVQAGNRSRRDIGQTANRDISSPSAPTLRSCLKSDRPRKSKTVTFSTAEFRDYRVILGENPACSQGAPLSIGWDYDEALSRIVDLDEYETYRPRPPRTLAELNLSKEDREAILKQNGYTQFQIACAVRRNNRSRAKRFQTINGQGFSRMEECSQSARRKVLRAVGLRKKDHAEVMALWKRAARVNASQVYSDEGASITSSQTA